MKDWLFLLSCDLRLVYKGGVQGMLCRKVYLTVGVQSFHLLLSLGGNNRL